MKKKEIESIYLKKLKIFNEHNKNYYEKSKPKITDADFDNLKIEISLIANTY